MAAINFGKDFIFVSPSLVSVSKAINKFGAIRVGDGSHREFKGARRKGKKKRDPVKDSARDGLKSSSSLLLQCYIYLSEGLATMLAALCKECTDFQNPNTFNSEQERFIQHFEHLQKAETPEHISYHSFKESTASAKLSNIAKQNYFREAQQITTSLRGSFSIEPDKLLELRQIEQVAEHNRIALNVINQVGAHDPSEDLTRVHSSPLLCCSSGQEIKPILMAYQFQVLNKAPEMLES